MSECVYVCVCIYMCVYVYVFMYVCMYICVKRYRDMAMCLDYNADTYDVSGIDRSSKLPKVMLEIEIYLVHK